MHFDISSNIHEVAARFSRAGRSQIPFAASRALNATAFDVRKEVVERTFPKSFTLRNKRFPSIATRVATASKARLIASVGDRTPGGRDYLVTQAEGGTKRPRGRHLAVPEEQHIRRTAGGAVRRTDKPRRLLEDLLSPKDAGRQGGRGNRKRSKPKPFIITDSHGLQWIVRRQRKVEGLQFLYAMPTDARIKKRFPFHEDALAVARRVFAGHFAREFERAMRTARR